MSKTWLCLILVSISGGSCFLLSVDPYEPAVAADYVSAAMQDLQKGDLASAEDILFRALNRFPENGAVVLWNVEIHKMRWRDEAALGELLNLNHSEKLEMISRAELMGKIGDLLFQQGKYGESADYLRTGAVGDQKKQRQAKAELTLSLPYARLHEKRATVELPLIPGPLPEILCSFGEKQRNFVLDTGSSMTTLTKSLSAELRVEEIGEFGLVRDGLGNSFAAWVGVLPKFALGEVELGNSPVLVVEDDRLALKDQFGGPEIPPSGVIGLDVLFRFRVHLDPARRLAILEVSGDTDIEMLDDRDTVSSIAVDGCMLLPVQIEGVKLWFILDTGASHSSLTELGLATLPGGARRATTDHRRMRSLGGRSFLIRQVQGLTLKVSGVQFQAVALPVVARLKSGVFPVHGVIGADLLMRCRSSFDSGHVRLRGM